MAFDGITVAAVVEELNDKLLYGSIAKVAQPVKDGLLLIVHAKRERYFLMISADPSSPAVYLREDTLPSPDTAPAFCMALRKHIGGGRIVGILQSTSEVTDMRRGLERIIVFTIEHISELGDSETRYLIAELMGRHSNIILCRDDFTIMDSIRHISFLTSSLREVLPGRDYYMPEALRKADPLSVEDKDIFLGILGSEHRGENVFRRLYGSFAGISPKEAGDLLLRAHVDADKTVVDLSDSEASSLFHEFRELMDSVLRGDFPEGIIEAAIKQDEEKQKKERLKSRTADIRETLKQLSDRAVRKLSLLEKELKDTEKRDRYRLCGELINVYGYGLAGGEDHLDCEDYHHDNAAIRIPLDPDLSASQNAARYFERYDKLKRAEVKVREQIEECEKNIYRLRSLDNALALAETDGDIALIRDEMREAGYLKKEGSKRAKKRKEAKSPPLHFVSGDGIDIYVGRNNYQNEELSFRLAEPDDWWFHAKGVPGSHVIAKTGRRELPDRTCLEAAALAAYYSSAGREEDPHIKIEVDYVQRKELKRVPGAPRGYCIYHSNYSLMIEPRKSV